MGNSHNAKSNQQCPVRVLHAEHASKKMGKSEFYA